MNDLASENKPTPRTQGSNQKSGSTNYSSDLTLSLIENEENKLKGHIQASKQARISLLSSRLPSSTLQRLTLFQNQFLPKEPFETASKQLSIYTFLAFIHIVAMCVAIIYIGFLRKDIYLSVLDFTQILTTIPCIVASIYVRRLMEWRFMPKNEYENLKFWIQKLMIFTHLLTLACLLIVCYVVIRKCLKLGDDQIERNFVTYFQVMIQNLAYNLPWFVMVLCLEIQFSSLRNSCLSLGLILGYENDMVKRGKTLKPALRVRPVQGGEAEGDLNRAGRVTGISSADVDNQKFFVRMATEAGYGFDDLESFTLPGESIS